MGPTPRRAPKSATGELHELANVLSSARMWLVILENLPAEKRDASLPDVLAKLNKAVGDAEECCQRLRDMTPRGRAE